MFSLYLLFTLVASHSIYASDQTKELVPTPDLALVLPANTIPFPDGLVTMVLSDQAVKPSIHGFFNTKRGTTYVSILSLAKPDKNNPEENQRKLTLVQNLLAKNVNNELNTRCAHCINQDDHFSEFISDQKSHWHREYKNIALDILTTACTNTNGHIPVPDSTGDCSNNFYEKRSLYKVIGCLYLGNGSQNWYIQKLGQTMELQPCEYGNSQQLTMESVVTTNPPIRENERRILFDELFNNQRSDFIAQAAFERLESKSDVETKKDVMVTLINPLVLNPLIKQHSSRECTLL